MTRPIPYIPSSYRRFDGEDHALWHDGGEPGAHVDRLREIVERSLVFLRRTIEFRPVRRLHICCFATNDEARAALARDIPSTMALAPYSDDAIALILLQSPAADRRNGDPARMLRVVTHEITHQLVAEATGSHKILGDGNRGMRVHSWLNEGLAEVTGNLAGDRAAVLERAVETLRRQEMTLTFDQLDRHLDDLHSDLQTLAFSYSTGAVYTLVKRHGLQAVFHSLRRHDDACAGDQTCEPGRFGLTQFPVTGSSAGIAAQRTL